MEREELLKKLLVLSKRGVNGEAKNAEMLLNKLLKKHGMTLEDINNVEQTKDYDFEFESKWEENLLNQLAYAMFPEKDVYVYTYKRKKYNRTHLMLKLTSAEFIEFDYAYNVYRESWNKELDLFYHAFIQKNKLFPPENKKKKNVKCIDDEYSKEELFKMSMFANGINKTSMRRALTNEVEE